MKNAIVEIKKEENFEDEITKLFLKELLKANKRKDLGIFGVEKSEINKKA